MKEPILEIYISFFGDDFDPKEFTNTLGITPTASWRKGDPARYGLGKKEDCWELSTGKVETYDDDELWKYVYDKLISKKDNIKELKNKMKFKVKVYVVIEMTKDEEPGLFINSKIINLLSEIGASVEVDMYIYS